MHTDKYPCFLAYTHMLVLMFVLVAIVPWLAGCIRCLTRVTLYIVSRQFLK
jgi:hypothetical protein